MITIECPHCGCENQVRDDDEEPTCELCGSYLEALPNEEEQLINYDDIPF
jgi:hypothetical protein